MNMKVNHERALENGFVPVLPLQKRRMHVYAKRAACGCFLRVHAAPSSLAKAAAQCPRCNDVTPPKPVTDLTTHADATYDNYCGQALRDEPHLTTGGALVLDTVFDRIRTEVAAPSKPSTALVDALLDEIANNVRYLLQHHRKPDM